ncbi:MAG: CRISPR-associated DxTHG motif protein [Bernardetiaceae bacterium]|nr:CRISPR-associated DxTHG motif protein [Bernardetiaceae bacterium]
MFLFFIDVTHSIGYLPM